MTTCEDIWIEMDNLEWLDSVAIGRCKSPTWELSSADTYSPSHSVCFPFILHPYCTCRARICVQQRRHSSNSWQKSSQSRDNVCNRDWCTNAIIDAHYRKRLWNGQINSWNKVMWASSCPTFIIILPFVILVKFSYFHSFLCLICISIFLSFSVKLYLSSSWLPSPSLEKKI